MNSLWTDLRRKAARLRARFAFEKHVVSSAHRPAPQESGAGGWLARENTHPVFVTLDETHGWYPSALQLMTPEHALEKKAMLDDLPALGAWEPAEQDAELDSSVYVMN